MAPFLNGNFGHLNTLPAWGIMWVLAVLMFVSCKWLTWWQGGGYAAPTTRSLAYLFAWPGLDAKTFLRESQNPHFSSARDWSIALLKTLFGAALLWTLAPMVPDARRLVKGWIGMIGLILLLHFGFFHLLSLFWQSVGIEAQPVMNSPTKATSLSEFWGRRWNSAFNCFVHDNVFRPLYRPLGAAGATMCVFLVSGLIHDLIISVPAGAGYGLPTLYFLVQGAGLLFERSRVGGKLGLRHGWRGWAFVLLVTAAPAFWLFHPAFVTRVILPFMQAIRAS
jgi:D-alanyl-lipoteichoic acid acyltransferase DltB (MBOAT superfamily)